MLKINQDKESNSKHLSGYETTIATLDSGLYQILNEFGCRSWVELEKRLILGEIFIMRESEEEFLLDALLRLLLMKGDFIKETAVSKELYMITSSTN